ncbi:MAG: acyltransferase [Pirellulaceae bacterium]|nr:acyltransferase [Pirellulaceae bacterium]
MIHSTADVQSTNVGTETRIWQYVVVLPGARIGSDCNICSHCFIENDVTIGNRVTIKCGVQIWDGITIEDDVFIGPNVTFTNDIVPRSRKIPAEFIPTTVRKGASLGANATMLPGIEIGRSALVGAGSVVTKSGPDYAIVMGSPALQRGWICDCGAKLQPASETAQCECGKIYFHENSTLIEVENGPQ